MKNTAKIDYKKGLEFIRQLGEALKPEKCPMCGKPKATFITDEEIKKYGSEEAIERARAEICQCERR